ncbi:hypothetical protein PUN28_020696 [Cardiocondyla obscurior]|uniref:Uncharacterized protein n=1 Tax=Cardiocondyla obscurior TaxID=286306 RepID=A0AAW2E6W2_9HYME
MRFILTVPHTFVFSSCSRLNNQGELYQLSIYNEQPCLRKSPSISKTTFPETPKGDRFSAGRRRIARIARPSFPLARTRSRRLSFPLARSRSRVRHHRLRLARTRSRRLSSRKILILQRDNFA